MEWIEHVPSHQPFWLFTMLFVILGFYAWIRKLYGNNLVQSMEAGINFQVAAGIFKDKSLLQSQLDRVLYALYFLSFSTFFYILELRFELRPYGLNGISVYFFNLLVLLSLSFARWILINLLGWLFDRLGLFREFLYHGYIYNKLLGVVILPFLVFLFYTRGFLANFFFYIAIASALGIFVMRYIRGIVFSLKKDISIFYMFLYLCALEMAPLVLLYRWLEGIVSWN